MTDARDVIARALASVGAFDSEGEATVVDMALHAAGYRILGPDDLDEKTVERCVEVANAEVAKHQGPFTSQPAYVAACTIRDALRALKEKRSNG